MTIRKRLTRLREQRRLNSMPREIEGLTAEQMVERVRSRLEQEPPSPVRNVMQQIVDGARAGELTGVPSIVFLAQPPRNEED